MKKFIISMISAVLILASFVGMPVSNAASISASMSGSTVTEGKQASVTIRFTQPVKTAGFNLKYNPDELSYDSSSLGSNLQGKPNGSRKVAFVAGMGDTIKSITFYFTTSKVGKFSVSATNVEVSGANDETVDIASISTSVTVTKKQTETKPPVDNSQGGTNQGGTSQGGNNQGGTSQGGNNQGSSTNKPSTGDNQGSTTTKPGQSGSNGSTTTKPGQSGNNGSTTSKPSTTTKPSTNNNSSTGSTTSSKNDNKNNTVADKPQEDGNSQNNSEANEPTDQTNTNQAIEGNNSNSDEENKKDLCERGKLSQEEIIEYAIFSIIGIIILILLIAVIIRELKRRKDEE